MAAGTDTTRNTAAEDIHIKYVIVEHTGRQIITMVNFPTYLRGAHFVEGDKHKSLHKATEGEVPIEPEG